jgi:hypothetical protein
MPQRLSVLILASITAVLAAYLFQLWARHHRRVMIHRERMAALEKGVEVPPLVEEIQRGSVNVQRLLLLAGLCWTSVGVALIVAFNELEGQSLSLPWGQDNTGQPFFFELRLRAGLWALGLAPLGIGISHVIVYFVGRRRNGA